jgi:hypothetical protein
MSDLAAVAAPTSSLRLQVVRADGRHDRPFSVAGVPTDRPLTLDDITAHAAPRKGLHPEVNAWRSRNGRRVLTSFVKARSAARFGNLMGLTSIVDSLFLAKFTADGDVLPLGIAAVDLLTTSGANYMRDGFVGTTEPENARYHALGTGTTAPAIGDTAMGTEWSTSEYTSSVRANATYTAPQSLRAQSIATNTKANAGTSAVTEYGILSSATPAAGTLLARFTFSAVNLALGEGLQGTFNLDFSTGG